VTPPNSHEQRIADFLDLLCWIAVFSWTTVNWVTLWAAGGRDLRIELS
jgi:hypothetical protein